MITYASPVWYTNKIVISRKLRAIQRLPLIMITKSFKTTSNASLNILSKIPPVHLKIEKENEQYAIVKGTKSFLWDNKTFTGNQIMHKYDHWQDHPANKIAIPTTDNEEQVCCKIYTNGSKMENNVGAAFVVLNTNNLIVIAKKY